MRAYGALTNHIPFPPDEIYRILLTGGSSAQAMDWASTARQIARVSGFTTAGSFFGLIFNPVSTHAAVPATGTSITTGTSAGSTGNNILIHAIPSYRDLQIPAWSTGFSVAAFTSGYAIIEVWKR